MNIVDAPVLVQSTASVVNKNTTTTATTVPVTKSVKSASSASVAPLRVPFEVPTSAPVPQRAPSPSSVPAPRAQAALDVPEFPTTSDIPDMAIRVVVRKRPISRAELQRGDLDVMEMDEAGGVYIHEPKVRVDLTKVTETHQFYFDD